MLDAYQHHDCRHRPHGGKRQNFRPNGVLSTPQRGRL